MEKILDSNEPEKAVIAGLSADSMDEGDRSTEESLDELEALLETAGGICLGRILQNRNTPEPRTYIGKGKIEEMKALAEGNDCTLAVFDNELSPSQIKAISDDLGLRVVDRSSLILDIFASRARTKEGRLQVELAQYKYLLPRLTGMWKHLSSQTGSSAPIGTRGPGETQLESDRRHIRRKIVKLEEELREVIKSRETQRRLREKNNIPVIALVGYTNAGKSTLLNTLTGAGIQAEDRLFDTLDATTRRLAVSESCNALISDTVGFIRKLPHHLVNAFKATLEELKHADLLIHVIDASSAQWQGQAGVVEDLIEELEVSATPRIEVFNKCDLPGAEIRFHGEDSVGISAKTGQGIQALLKMIEEKLSSVSKKTTLRIPYDKAGLVERLHRDSEVKDVRYLEGYIELDAVLSPGVYERFREWVDEV